MEQANKNVLYLIKLIFKIHHFVLLPAWPTVSWIHVHAIIIFCGCHKINLLNFIHGISLVHPPIKIVMCRVEWIVGPCDHTSRFILFTLLKSPVQCSDSCLASLPYSSELEMYYATGPQNLHTSDLSTTLLLFFFWALAHTGVLLTPPSPSLSACMIQSSQFLYLLLFSLTPSTELQIKKKYPSAENPELPKVFPLMPWVDFCWD